MLGHPLFAVNQSAFKRSSHLKIIEQKISFLLIDLSGYTALAEAHGGKVASEIVADFVDIVQSHVVAPCEVSERTGDELVITCEDPNLLVDVALKVLKEFKAQSNFPSFHAFADLS